MDLAVLEVKTSKAKDRTKKPKRSETARRKRWGERCQTPDTRHQTPDTRHHRSISILEYNYTTDLRSGVGGWQWGWRRESNSTCPWMYYCNIDIGSQVKRPTQNLRGNVRKIEKLKNSLFIPSHDMTWIIKGANYCVKSLLPIEN